MTEPRAPLAWALLFVLASQLLTTTLIAATRTPEAPVAGQTGRAFRVYDALLFRNKPDLGGLGLLPANGTGNFWSRGASQDDVDATAIRREIGGWPRNFQGLFYIDIENWPIYEAPETQANENIAKLGQVADIVRETAPGLQFGFYAVLPENVYWPLVAGTPGQLQHWRETARRTDVLARKVDVIMPSLYTFYDSESDRAAWAKWARITLTEARRYGKPVYAFLWPQFHDSNEKLHGQLVPGDYWLMELEICRRYADGVVLWGGYETPWDENAAWWQQTKRFLATLK